jgi:hypothetical protein
MRERIDRSTDLEWIPVCEEQSAGVGGSKRTVLGRRFYVLQDNDNPLSLVADLVLGRTRGHAGRCLSIRLILGWCA